MQPQSITYNLDRLALYAVIGMGIMTVCASTVAVIAFWRDKNSSAKKFLELAQYGGALRILAVGLIIVAATFLALADKIKGEAVVAIISGVAGYVLGGLQRDKDKTPKSPGDRE